MKVRFKYMSIVIAYLLLAATLSCKKNDTPVPDPKEIIVAKEANVISNKIWNDNIISLDSSNYTITLKKDVTSSQQIKNGDIIISAVGEGLLRKVKNMSTINNQIIIETESATLTEVIQQGLIEYNQPLTISQIKNIEYNYAGVKLNTDIFKSGEQTVFNWDINTVLYDEDGNPATTSDQVKLVGTFNCDWQFALRIDVGFLTGLKEVKFGFESSENLNLKLVAGLQYSFEKDITLATINFTPIFVTVGIVPVVFTPQLKIKVGIDGYANASVTSGIIQSLSFDAGIKYLKGQGWSPFKTFEKNISFQPPQLNMNASAGAYLKPELIIKIYSVAGPYANVKMYGRLDANLLQTPWWKVYGGITMNAGAKVDILEKFLLEYTVSDLINYELLLAQATTPPVQIPTVTTAAATNVTASGARLGGNATSDGNATVTEKGVVYSTTQNPTTSNTKVSYGSGTGAFTVNVSNLSANTTYYVRAYAINSQGTAYGTQVSFTTGQTLSLATVTTSAATSITTTGATMGGNVTSDGNATVTEKGVVYSTTQNPTTSNTKVSSGSGTGAFTVNVSSLSANTTYYVRAYAINSQGTAYGTQVSFTTGQTLSLATVTTSAASNITTTGATMGGNVTSDGNATVTEKGVVYSTTQNPTTSNTKVSSGSGTGVFTVNVSSLSANTTYYVRAYAINSQGTAYGTQVIFTTGQTLSLATVTTTSATNITTTGASLGGNVTSDGNATVTEKGVVYSTTQNPTTSNTKFSSGSGTGAFTVNVSNLTANTTYYVRAYAINSQGTAYGSNVSFTTQAISGNTVTDIDGNVYNTVTIGTQVWMAENLKTTKYRNGDLIGTTTPSTMNILTQNNPKYQWAYAGNESNVATYGRLYTWHAATDSRNVCPTGWHLPTEAEWTTLTTFLGGESVAGGKLKESGTSLWWSPNTGATNSSGFTALPGGSRASDGAFYSIGRWGYWWSSTESSTSSAEYRTMHYDRSSVTRNYYYYDKTRGFSVRCLRDN